MLTSSIRRAFVAAVILVFASPHASGAAAPRRVAVLEFTASWSGQCAAPNRVGEVADRCEALLLLTDEARAGVLEVLRPPGFIVMTRENTAQILKEMVGGAGACTEGECEVETAKLIGAELVVSGQLSVLEGTWIASVKLHDVKSAALLGTARARGKTKLELMDAVKREVELVARKAAGGGAATVTARPGMKEGSFEDTQGLAFGTDAEEVLVAFESEPAGASVLLDGQLLCKETPCRKRLAAGEHQASFQKERYAPSAQRFRAEKGATVRASLAPTFGWIAVETVPGGAVVSIDGVDAGKGPVAWREVEAGTAEVLVADPCYLRSGERVTVKAGERRTVKLTAKPRLAGLKLNAEDEKGNALEAEVVVDGTVVGTAGSTLKLPVCSGKVSVNLGKEPFEQELKLEEGKVTTLTAKPGAGGAAAGGMVRLPGGTYTMGETKRTVTVQPFLLDVTEVTAGAYAACVKSGKCNADGLGGDYATYGVAGKEHQPVNYVDWNQATAYCAAVGKRLPTEEEWEWAARGAERGTTYPWGNEQPGNQLCWNGGTVQRREKKLGTCAAGTFPAGNSPQGIADLAGNVWEWTSSAYDSSNRVNRGGSWGNVDGRNLTASFRFRYDPSYRDSYLGFRCARTP